MTPKLNQFFVEWPQQELFKYPLENPFQTVQYFCTPLHTGLYFRIVKPQHHYPCSSSQKTSILSYFIKVIKTSAETLPQKIVPIIRLGIPENTKNSIIVNWFTTLSKP